MKTLLDALNSGVMVKEKKEMKGIDFSAIPNSIANEKIKNMEDILTKSKFIGVVKNGDILAEY